LTSKAVVGTTDADGRVTFTLDRAGPWLLKATLFQESTDADIDWHSLFTTLTLQPSADIRTALQRLLGPQFAGQ
jgi:uncharacterized GH25 family protein